MTKIWKFLQLYDTSGQFMAKEGLSMEQMC